MSTDTKQVLTEFLVLSTQRDSEAAFRDLYALWHHDLRRLALVRVEQPHAADEVMAEAWLAIARGVRRLDDPACFPRWAMRIVERRAVDWVRRRCTERAHSAVATAEVDRLAPANLHPSEPTDEITALRRAVAVLPADARELLHLFYDAGRSIAEIAAILDIPVGTVKSRLFTVREILKQKLNQGIR
ncbi:MAG: sigma-70 family RNA polymerase sigma factor [Candidatus Didemnitutus sp.]|nr:sigma-70 family RNA polymerase sigma factor [Candidatus Didemnitutus sp.]